MGVNVTARSVRYGGVNWFRPLGAFGSDHHERLVQKRKRILCVPNLLQLYIRGVAFEVASRDLAVVVSQKICTTSKICQRAGARYLIRFPSDIHGRSICKKHDVLHRRLK